MCFTNRPHPRLSRILVHILIHVLVHVLLNVHVLTHVERRTPRTPGHHDLHRGVMQNDETIRKVREQQAQGRRRSSIVHQVLHQFAVIENVVDMNRLTLQFNDPQVEAKFEEFTRTAKFDHMRYALREKGETKKGPARHCC